MKIQSTHVDITGAQLDNLVRDELPFMHAAYEGSPLLEKSIREWLDFYYTQEKKLPIYTLSSESAQHLSSELTRYYAMLLSALKLLFKLSDREAHAWFKCSFTENPARFKRFFEFAHYTFNNSKPWHHPDQVALYGRFDAVVDPENATIKGVYEFNGDTPVMLFESINLQNKITTALGDPDKQANEWWLRNLEKLAFLNNKAVGVVCDINAIEDAATSETIAQLFEEIGARTYYSTLESLNHRLLNLEKPFFIEGVQESLDAVFVLLPWEEMLASGDDILVHWKTWVDQVLFFEPPWRWFLGHKGIMAFVTHLLETNEEFRQQWGDCPHLPTYLSADRFIETREDYVAKPVIGRLSQNITIIKNGQAAPTTPGAYSNEPLIYQRYCAPSIISGRDSNCILGGWVSADKEVSTLCFREFDNDVLELSNERFVAHWLVD